ncbi:hypothetical protein CLAFUW4_08723 [Fulvia fulva]|uniref:Uncharacterized protein n=1 Tax=Passalora fulva TaxID=5499 RepID=A0A9Q8PGF6_PASFU|nr:uncharacterized protein CLAFUR5_08821 [Fulvia fulva]KAK4613266.1 hypothetical protein CLAFUR4_08728 [Fulvia fulva]KAK4614582.1 hypothetical protein CLAFUR0_08724 [Fulvia fulva]UJO22041.1 hypothetical protein CLAFUR5_08821 [Fulvia fulva]WPV20507.1 hypothetical protein CLAFUW4_08723 [Fulvia fulva]WPV35054.1 hypothetical protein CLAFUW7_08723 [Fulvia fulva]
MLWRRLIINNPHINSWLLASNHNGTTLDPRKISTPFKGPPLQPDGSPPASKHPKTTLVLATLASTDNSWVEEELGDLLGAYTNLYTAIYVVDDENAPLHTPANNGHEAMAYLTYLIEFYDNLPEISIFMHGHREAWHNNFLLEMSSSETIRHFHRDKVMRYGYFNLRCHWAPGCQPGFNPAATQYDNDKPEEMVIAEAWQTLFPSDEVPETLAQPCCSQFAVTREAVHAPLKQRTSV